MGNHYDPRDPEWDFDAQRAKAQAEIEACKADPQKRMDRADELLDRLANGIGTGSAVAEIRKDVMRIKHVLRGLDW